MKSAVVKRSVLIDGHRTSVSLEEEFWLGLRQIAKSRSSALATLVGEIDAKRINRNLSSALRLFVFQHYFCQYTQSCRQRLCVVSIGGKPCRPACECRSVNVQNQKISHGAVRA